jgi:hypothetical protein
MSVTMSGKLPAGDGNGLVAVAGRMIDPEDDSVFVCISIVTCKSFKVDKETKEKLPVARTRRIEVIQDPEDMKIGRRLMERALQRRTGRDALPYDLAAEIDDAFGDLGEEDN